MIALGLTVAANRTNPKLTGIVGTNTQYKYKDVNGNEYSVTIPEEQLDNSFLAELRNKLRETTAQNKDRFRG